MGRAALRIPTGGGTEEVQVTWTGNRVAIHGPNLQTIATRIGLLTGTTINNAVPVSGIPATRQKRGPMSEATKRKLRMAATARKLAAAGEPATPPVKRGRKPKTMAAAASA